jgi:nondiscriminating aspartyl-tRNA synthetase
MNQDKENIREKILALLKEKKIPFSLISHKEILSSQEAAQVTGFPLEEGVKSLIICGKKSKKHFLLCILGHQKLNMPKVNALLGESFALEKPSMILETYGLLVGGIPPFGFLLDIPTYFDESILLCKEVIFSSGLTTESIRMATKDLLAVVCPQITTFSIS